MRPLRFATILATLTAIAILLGQLWLRSIDGRTTISLGQAAREGSDAVGVAITGLNRRIGTRAHLPGTRTAADDPVPPGTKRARGARLRAASHDACVARWRTKVGAADVVLVDRPGRGYGDDYSPWLLDPAIPVGELVHVRGAGVADEGVLAA